MCILISYKFMKFLVEYKVNDRLRHLPCGHAFHVKCIDVWLKQSITCPKCRMSVRGGLKRLERVNGNKKITSNGPVQAISSSVRRNVQNTEQVIFAILKINFQCYKQRF